LTGGGGGKIRTLIELLLCRNLGNLHIQAPGKDEEDTTDTS
jgi:hypothetical protein